MWVERYAGPHARSSNEPTKRLITWVYWGVISEAFSPSNDREKRSQGSWPRWMDPWNSSQTYSSRSRALGRDTGIGMSFPLILSKTWHPIKLICHSDEVIRTLNLYSLFSRPLSHQRLDIFSHPNAAHLFALYYPSLHPHLYQHDHICHTSKQRAVRKPPRNISTLTSKYHHEWS